jgi:Skp family chaperone for outer membrane proteins
MRRLSYGGGVFLILTVLAVAGRSWSDGKPKPPAPRTRVAVVNIAYVVKNSPKYKSVNEKVQAKVAGFQKRAGELQEQLKALQKEMQAPGTSADRREELEIRAKRMQRTIEDDQADARRLIGKENRKMMVELYNEVRQATERYARAHGIELVLEYNDAAPDAPQEMNNPANIERKLQASAAGPLYAAPGVDISRELIAALNAAASAAPVAGNPR